MQNNSVHKRFWQGDQVLMSRFQGLDSVMTKANILEGKFQKLKNLGNSSNFNKNQNNF
jgi:hypothetical protein